MRRVSTPRTRSWLAATIVGLAALLPLAPVASAAAPVAPTASAVAASRYLNLTGQAQEKSNWCWAATGNSIARYYGKNYSQNQFCNLAFGYSQNAACPNDQATLANDQRAFRAIGITPGSYVNGTLSFSTLVTEINANRPVMTRIGWKAGGGHMMDIIGYDSADSSIEYYNPWGSDPRYNYSTYNWYRNNTQFAWTHSLYRIGA
ncbi:papain-like cysteine protease family protein [Kribbella sp. CA-293567]|uniref:papain-like cysteine protease family protein n=1 Tax=Kribbella sp. CA-293567 TaxID=3002436 RepID=UPI0022DE8F67|nr:papain-like cysteine protease family protein [Kribbella sp. CA-293567]WBQ02073.1 C39 family peptidase [Kribbella sp. CA-293567]